VTTPKTDRERRAVVVCACCGRTGAHRGHGLCVACYARWVYWAARHRDHRCQGQRHRDGDRARRG
jgi:hypothetical protein